MAKIVRAKDDKIFNMRLPKETWMFLKVDSLDKELSMTDIVYTLIDKYKKREEAKKNGK